MEGSPPSTDLVLSGVAALGFAMALLVTGIQGTVRHIRRYTVFMPSGPTSSNFLDQPNPMELRVVERGGKRWLQQWRHPPGGEFWKYEWVDVAELPWPPSNVRKLR